MEEKKTKEKKRKEKIKKKGKKYCLPMTINVTFCLIG